MEQNISKRIAAVLTAAIQLLFVFCVIGANDTVTGLTGALMVLLTALASIEIFLFLVQKPLNPLCRWLVDADGKKVSSNSIRALLFLIGSFCTVALPISLVVWLWANHFPAAFGVTQQLVHPLPPAFGVTPQDPLPNTITGAMRCGGAVVIAMAFLSLMLSGKRMERFKSASDEVVTR